MRNVFVEGIQGMGKSTLVNAISKEFPQYHVCREWDYSPIDLAWCTWMTKEEYENILEKYKEIQEEIVKKTVEEHGHYVISYLQVITDIPNFHKDLEAYWRNILTQLKRNAAIIWEMRCGISLCFNI